MFSLIKEVFTVLLSFRSSSAKKCLSLTDELCMVRYTLIDLNPVQLKQYPFMVSLDKYSGGCNYSNDLSSKIRVSSKTKDINFKIFNMITNINEVKTFKSKFYCTAWNLNQKCNSQTG